MKQFKSKLYQISAQFIIECVRQSKSSQVKEFVDGFWRRQNPSVTNIKHVCQKEIAFNTEMQWMQLVRVKQE